MQISKITELGMTLDACTYKTCYANVGIGNDFATIYYIETLKIDRNKGYATELILQMKKHYKKLGKKFGTSVALSPQMQHLIKKLKLKEYN